MGILYNRLLILMNETPSDAMAYHIALTMLQNFDQLSKLGIVELAELCNVSKSSISKFIRALGYHDFGDFRYAAELENLQLRPGHTFSPNVLGYLDSNSYTEYVQTITDDLFATLKNLEGPELDRLAQDIYTHKYVGAFGLMFSATAAIDLQIKMGRQGRFIATNMDDQKATNYIQKAAEDTLVILFSDQGDIIDRKEMIDYETGENIFAITHAKLVMITSNHKMEHDHRISYIVPYIRMTELRTHRLVYPLITDLLAHKYHALIARQ